VASSSPKPREVVKLDLSAGSVETVMVDGEPHVVFRPAVEAIGLDYSTQLRKLRERSWANRRDIPTVAEDGKTRLMVAVDVRTFLMWLATVNENKVAETARPVLVAYQQETTAAVNDYWTKGQATNPRVVTATEITPGTVTWDHAAAVARLHYGMNVDAHSFKELLVAGGILTTRNGAPHRKWEHLFWPSPAHTRWEIHASVLPQLIAFAVKIRRELANAERDLQMSLPMPLTVLADNVRQIGGVR
jgi:hypothetical protein